MSPSEKRRGVWLVALCCAVYFTSYITRKSYDASILAICDATGLARTSAGLASMAAVALYGSGQFVTGFLADRFDSRKIIFLALLITAGCNVAMPWIVGCVPAMVALWAVNGFAQAMFWPPLVKIVADNLSPSAYKGAVFWVSVAADIAIILVFVLVSGCIRFAGWRLSFDVVAVAALAMAALGAAAGAANGLLVARGGMAPFIATLGTLVAFRSVAVWIVRGGQYFCGGSAAFVAAGRGLPIPGTNIARAGARPIPLELPYATIAWVLVVLAALYLVHRTRLGRYIVAVGSNERAARYAAVPVRLVKFAAYAILGALTGLAAFLYSAQYTSVNSAVTGQNLELDAIAAVVIGGTRMEGGRGSIVGTVVGVLLLGVIRNMMVMLGVNSYAQGLVQGLIILAAVLAQRLGASAGARRASA